jgi:GGDEF domain-containing protein
MAHTPRNDGIKRAEELNNKINDAFVHWKGRVIAIRASIGLQAFGAEDEAEKVLACTDQAMYRIKQIKEGTPSDRDLLLPQ